MSLVSPYAPPAVPHELPVASSDGYLPLGWKTTAATLAIASVCVANAITIVLVLAVGDVSESELEGQLGKAALLFLVGMAAVVLGILAPVFFLVWFHRAAKNVRAFGHDGLEYSPGWCVGWWFIPLAMLWKPYRAMKEVFRASDPEAVREGSSSEWLLRPVPAMLGLWWGAWIVSKMIDRVSSRIHDVSTASTLGIVAALVSMVAGAYIVMIMRTVAKNQAASWAIVEQRSHASGRAPYPSYGPAYDPGYGPPGYGPPGYAPDPR